MCKKINDYISIRLSDSLKQEFEFFCKACEITVSNAIILFINKTIEEMSLPFDISVGASLPEAGGAYRGGELQNARISVRVDKETRDAFQEVSDKIGIPASRIIKVFMIQCVKDGRMPFALR